MSSRIAAKSRSRRGDEAEVCCTHIRLLTSAATIVERALTYPCILLENNVVYRCKSAGFHRHYGRENIIRNNIFAFGVEHQLMRSREEEHVSFVLTNNIVCYDTGSLLGSTWKNDRFVMDNNVYWKTGAGASAADIAWAGATLVEWRKHGHDLHSIVADPLFVAPDKHDFRLQRNSPALQLGFRPIDLSEVGVRRKFREQVRDTDR